MNDMGEVVEGVPTAHEVVLLAKKHGLGPMKLPLYYAVDAVLSGSLTPQQALEALVTLPVGQERFM